MRKERADIHIRPDKELSDKAKKISNKSHTELYELGCIVEIKNMENEIDKEILAYHKALAVVNELHDSITERLKFKEVPTKPDPDTLDDKGEDMMRNILPKDFFIETALYYMEDYNINDICELQNKNGEIFSFVLINLSHHNLKKDDINKLYHENKSE